MAFRPTLDFNITQQDVTNIPKDKTPSLTQVLGSGYPVVTPAVNSGAVEIACVINRKCPFVKSPFFNDALIFNAQSIRSYPESVRNLLDTHEGTEGVYLKKQYVYRHTFIAGPTTKKVSVPSKDDKNKQPTYNIVLDKLDQPRGVFASSAPVYERYQRFIIQPTVFDNEILTPSQYQTEARKNTTSCKELPRWAYETVSKEQSQDVNVLMPKQIAGSTCNGYGIHWKVTKQTPLYLGQDFFIEFHCRAKSIDVPSSIKDQTNKFLSNVFNDAKYRPLDVKFKETEPAVDNCGKTIALHKNRGVVSYSDDGKDIAEDKKYDIRDQAYYVVEIGVGDEGKDAQHYFIMITQRGDPICLRIENGSSVVVGSPFAEGRNIENNSKSYGTRITGKQIIESDYCRMTVRNHLGDLHIVFEGPDFKSTPWIIHRVDSVVGSTSIKNDATKIMKQETKVMFVPKKPISIWGGNMHSGFLFGPLQYIQGGFAIEDGQQYVSDGSQANQPAAKPSTGLNPITFTIPARSDEQATVSVCNTQKNVSGIVGPGGGIVAISDDFRANSLALPSGIVHNITLTATDEKIPNNTNKHWFSQDAQRFKWVSRPISSGNDELKGNKTADGTFLHLNKPLKEIDSAGDLSEITINQSKLIDDPSSRVSLFTLSLSMKSGSHTFNDGSNGYDDGNDGNVWALPSCKTPILTMVRLSADPGGTTRWRSQPVDVSEHVLEYQDSWSAQDFSKIEHGGNIKFLITQGVQYSNDKTEYLMSLVDKAFYIEVWARYAAATNSSYTQQFGSSQESNCNYSLIPGYVKLFTGVCYGGTVQGEVGSRILECQIFDYTKILQDMLFFNAPFYDGVRDVNAVYEILKMAGFKDSASDDPGILLKNFSKNNDQNFHFAIGPDGRLVVTAAYALPNAYSKLFSPYFKFSDGSKFLDGIMQIASRGGKCFFFDAYGVAHYESYFDFQVVGTMVGVDNTMLGGEPPECIPNSDNRPGGTVGNNSSVVNPDALALWWYTTNPNLWAGQMVFNNVRAQRSVGDVFNHVKIMTNTPNFEVIYADDVDWSSIDNPTKEGFIGYMKTVYQQEGSFGSREAAQNIIQFYRAMRRPPLILNFETYGQPVRGLDLVRFNGQVARVMKVDATISPKISRWWNSIECEWLYAVKTNMEQAACTPEDTNKPKPKDNDEQPNGGDQGPNSA